MVEGTATLGRPEEMNCNMAICAVASCIATRSANAVKRKVVHLYVGIFVVTSRMGHLQVIRCIMGHTWSESEVADAALDILSSWLI